MTGKFTPTPEQAAVLEAAALRRGSLMIEAGAGCAKTSTLERAAEAIRVPALALAFNKRVAQDMIKKFPGNFTTKTLNGLGHGAWGRVLPEGTRLVLDDRKLGKLVTQVARDRKVDLSSDQWDGLRRLVSQAMQQGLVPDGTAPEGLVPDTQDGWRDVADATGMFEDDFQLTWELAREILQLDIAQARQGIISFDDQVYCSTMLGGKFPRFPVVFVDEDQDLSPLNHLMLGRCLAAEGRLFAVGDKRQGIYAFRGASGDSAEAIRGLRPAGEWTDLPLMTSFRCPRLVVERQLSHVPDFRAFASNPDGVIEHWAAGGGLQWEGWTWSMVETLRGAAGQVAILCRNNAPLLGLAFRLIRQGVGVVMAGRDIGKGLIALTRKIAPDDGVAADAMRGLITTWQASEKALAQAHDKPEKIAGITDRAECLLATLEGTLARDAGELRRQLERLFARDTGQVTLSSIHRAKGLEWDLVMHLDPWRVPSRQARRQATEGNSMALRQEMNLRYVAETRTKHTLVLASMEDFH